MSRFSRWLLSFVLALGFAALTMSCQVLFGDFKVGDQPRTLEAGQGGATFGPSGGAGNSGGGLDNGQVTGPILVVPRSDLYTSDLGAQTKFYVSLAQKPSGPVTLPINSSNGSEGTVSPTSLSFTPDDWNAPQGVTVTGVRDPQVGNQIYSVVVGPGSSADKIFDGKSTMVSITNIDNDSAGFFVTPTKGLQTTEAGGQAFFTVVLNSPPASDVFIALTSSDPGIGTVSPSGLTFTPDNWSAPQTVTVTGVNDDVVGEDRQYEIKVSPVMGDPSFAKLAPKTVSVTNQDNDHAGVMVALATGIDPSDVTRLRTSEAGVSATFTVVLNGPPVKAVTIAIASSSDEGVVSPAMLTFTALNWAAPQTVTVTGADNDNVADGNQPYQVKLGPITSDDTAYGLLTPEDLPSVNLVNVDNDKAASAITLLNGLDPNDASALLTTEKGTTATFSLVLTSKPNGPVQFGLTSTNTNEGKVSPAEVAFTAKNWNVAQVVTVTGVDDPTKDGNVVYAVRISAPTTDDLAYQKLPTTDVKVVNLDDDVAGIAPPKLLSGVDSGTKLVTSEANNGTATFSISLTSRPKSDVRVPITSSNTAEGKVSPTALTFTPGNYSVAQVVTVTGQQDPVFDGNQAYTVTVGASTSDDSNYVGLTQSIKVTNLDDDSAYIVPTPGYMGTTTEAGGTAVFGISLHSQPTDTVTVTFVSSNTKEGKVTPSTLTFTMANWLTSQNITVTGVDDDVADDTQSYNVQATGASNGDQNYKYATTTLNLRNTDNDNVGIAVVAAPNLQTSEAVGGKATFTVALASQPTGNVSVTVTSGNTKEGTVAPGALAFTTGTWNIPQTVTVTGVDDSIADGSQSYAVTLKTAASSADAKYAQLAAKTVSLTNKDDDVFGIAVAPTTCATTPDTTATFTVVLKSQPLGPVSIALSSDTPTVGKVAPATLSFTATSWNIVQTVTVTGVDDGTTSMMTPYKILTAAAVSTMDPNYSGLNALDVACVNTTPAPVEP